MRSNFPEIEVNMSVAADVSGYFLSMTGTGA